MHLPGSCFTQSIHLLLYFFQFVLIWLTVSAETCTVEGQKTYCFGAETQEESNSQPGPGPVWCCYTLSIFLSTTRGQLLTRGKSMSQPPPKEVLGTSSGSRSPGISCQVLAVSEQAHSRAETISVLGNPWVWRHPSQGYPTPTARPTATTWDPFP